MRSSHIPWFRRFQFKAVWACIALCIVPCCIVGVILQRLASGEMRSYGQAMYSGVIKDEADDARQVLSRYELLAKLGARSDAVSRLFDGGPTERSGNGLDALIAEESHIVRVCVYEMGGKFLAANGNGPRRPDLA